jgi:hypothetical protein
MKNGSEVSVKNQYPVGVLKQEIIKIYNSINQEIFGIGIKSQKIEFLGDRDWIPYCSLTETYL